MNGSIETLNKRSLNIIKLNFETCIKLKLNDTFY